jgi:hypothetical protein
MVVPGIEPGTSGSVTRNSDHKTTEAVDLSDYSLNQWQYLYTEEKLGFRRTKSLVKKARREGSKYKGMSHGEQFGLYNLI